MNYEIQSSRSPGVWCYWSSTQSRIKFRRRHIALLRGAHIDRKFRIVATESEGPSLRSSHTPPPNPS